MSERIARLVSGLVTVVDRCEQSDM